MSTPLHRHRTLFDDWRFIFISVSLTLIGYGVQVAMPVISAARMELLGFTRSKWAGWPAPTLAALRSAR